MADKIKCKSGWLIAPNEEDGSYVPFFVKVRGKDIKWSEFDFPNDLKNFVENYLDFCLDLTKYCLFRNLSCTKIPSTLEQRCIGYSNIPDILDYSNNLVEKVLEIKTMIKYDPAALTTVEAMFIKICRGI